MDALFYFPGTMVWPLIACVVLVGILVYFGIHIVARTIIFIDLALAQIAALGTAVGVLMGYELKNDATAIYLYSLLFAILGAFVFTIARAAREQIPQEAVIGMAYAVAFAATLLALAKSPLGPQELDRMLKGEILWIQPDFVLKTALISAIVGFIHLMFFKQFHKLSFEPLDQLHAKIRIWDFLFYASFAFVVTSSVAIAGVFLVFSYLIFPACASMLILRGFLSRLIAGWVIGILTSFIGLRVSYHLDLPVSPLIVCFLAAALVIIACVDFIIRHKARLVAIGRICMYAGVFTIFILILVVSKKPTEDPVEHAIHLLKEGSREEKITSIRSLSNYLHQKSKWLGSVIDALKDRDDEVRKAACGLLFQIKEETALPDLLKLLKDGSSDIRYHVAKGLSVFEGKIDSDEIIKYALEEEDDEIKIEILKVSLHCGNIKAVDVMIEMLEEGIGKVFEKEIYDSLHAHIEGVAEIKDLTTWWRENRSKIYWDAHVKKFRISED